MLFNLPIYMSSRLQFHLVTFFTISGFRFVFVRFCVACIYVFIYVILTSLEISTSNQKSYTNEGRIIQWPKGKGQTVKQWSTKHYPITNQRESHWMSRVNARVPDGLSVPDPMVWLVKLRLSDTNINVLETNLRKIQITYIKT
jgi:hypothetical protein